MLSIRFYMVSKNYFPILKELRQMSYYNKTNNVENILKNTNKRNKFIFQIEVKLRLKQS